MRIQEIKVKRRTKRANHVRRTLSRQGPVVRLSVSRSIKHISAQIFDERNGRTICGATTTSKKLTAELAGKSKTERASLVGAEIARLAKEKGIETVVFDRGSCKFHGRVKALAEAAREGGLKF